MFNRKVALIATLLLTFTSACGFLDQELFVDDELLEEEFSGSGGMSVSGVGGGGYGIGRVCGCGGRIHIGHAVIGQLQNTAVASGAATRNLNSNQAGSHDTNQDSSEDPQAASPVDQVAQHASTRRAAALDHFVADGSSRKNP